MKKNLFILICFFSVLNGCQQVQEKPWYCTHCIVGIPSVESYYGDSCSHKSYFGMEDDGAFPNHYHDSLVENSCGTKVSE